MFKATEMQMCVSRLMMPAVSLTSNIINRRIMLTDTNTAAEKCGNFETEHAEPDAEQHAW